MRTPTGDRVYLSTKAPLRATDGTVVGLVDYDVFYQSLNTLVLMGNLALPGRWTASFNS